MKYRTFAYKTIDNVYLLLKVMSTELNKSEGTLLDQFCLESTSTYGIYDIEISYLKLADTVKLASLYGVEYCAPLSNQISTQMVAIFEIYTPKLLRNNTQTIS